MYDMFDFASEILLTYTWQQSESESQASFFVSSPSRSFKWYVQLNVILPPRFYDNLGTHRMAYLFKDQAE